MRQPFRLQLFLYTVLLFAVAQGLALFVAEQLSAIRSITTTSLSEGMSALYFLIFFFAVTLFFLVLFHVYKGNALYRIIFVITVFAGLLKIFELVFPTSLSAIVAVVFIIGLFLLPLVWVHDLIVLFAGAGIGAIFGLQFHWTFAMILLVILSFYDIIAVFITKHMVTLAHELIKRSCTFALIIPEHIIQFRASLMAIRPGSGFLILGGGDIVLPMFLTASAYAARPIAGWCAIAGMCAGVFLNHIWLTSSRVPLPALPLISLGGIAGTFIGLIV